MLEDRGVSLTEYNPQVLSGGIAWIKISEDELIIGPMYGLPDRRRYFDVLSEITDSEILDSILAVRKVTSLILDRVGQINKARRDREKIIH